MKKLKQLFIVWIAIYPTLTGLMFIIGDNLNELPFYIRTLILTVILVPLMVLVMVPLWMRIFGIRVNRKQKSE